LLKRGDAVADVELVGFNEPIDVIHQLHVFHTLGGTVGYVFYGCCLHMLQK